MGYIGDYTGEDYNRKPQTLNRIGRIKGDTRSLDYGSVGGMASPAAGVLPKNCMHGQSLGLGFGSSALLPIPPLNVGLKGRDEACFLPEFQ